HRSLRDQRGLRRGGPRGDGRREDPPREDERARRRGGARTSDRRQRRAHPGHAAARAGGPRPQARHGRDLHRRRRGRGHDRGTGVMRMLLLLALSLAPAAFAAEETPWWMRPLLYPSRGKAHVRENVVYRTDDETKLLADIYTPPSGKNQPIVILIHGGPIRPGDQLK